MIDLVQLQDDVYGLLMSAPALATVNIVQERRFLVQSQVELDAIWSTQRNGRSGNGVLIEMPTTRVNSPGVSGAPEDVDLNVVCFQNGDAAFTPETGSGLFAELLAQLVKELLHLQVIGGLGTIEATGSEPARDYEFINAVRRKFRIVGARVQYSRRCALPVVVNNSGSVTLTSSTSGAVIHYTLDGSTPVAPTLADPISGAVWNPAAQTYAAPFAVSSGQVLRAVAMAEQFNPSEIITQTIA